MSIRSLPLEVLALVAGYLDVDEVHNLSTCSRHFRFMAYDQSICKKALQTTSSSVVEAQQALVDGDYAKALRRLVKRRKAISTASPFLVAVVAFADSWLYEAGTLCHIRDRQLRLLDVLHSATREIVVNIRKLLDEAIPESRSSRKYKFQLLYQSHGTVTCLYTHARPHLAHWLVVFNPGQGKVVTTRRLESAYKIFARNNSEFAYYGVQSDIGNDGFRRWMLQGFDIQKGEWLVNTLYLPNTVGSEIDATICFEMIDGYFCVLTSQTSFEMEKIEYTSYYDFFRFPLDRPDHEHIERPAKRNLFRRQHSEGPIDDRWTFMKIFSDEMSGELKILESRKEWLAGSSSATRTYYTKPVQITELGNCETSPRRSEEEVDRDQYAEDRRLAKFLGTSSTTNEGLAPRRDPSEVHVGDDGSKSVMFTLSKSFIRSYHPASQAFLDVVDDPRESEPCGQRIRIRAGTRLPRALSEVDTHHLQVQRQMDNAYAQSDAESGVVSWPPDGRSPALANLHDILNPPGYVGDVHGTWDQRSLIYATGGGTSGGVKVLVLVSFDPRVHLEGIMPFKSQKGPAALAREDLGKTLKELQERLTPGQAKGKEKEMQGPCATSCAAVLDEDVIVEHKSSASAVGTALAEVTCRTLNPQVETTPHPWVSYEEAQYLKIGLGCHFAK